MDVVNYGTQGFAARDVPVVAAPRLPEAVPQARPFAHRHPRQPLRRVALQMPDRFAGHRLLQRLQKTRHSFRSLPGIDKNMDVLRHHDVCPELKSKFRARLVERVAEPLTRSVAAQECIMAIARKRQLARLAALVVTNAAFLDVAFAGLGINDSHAGQDILLCCLLQEATVPALRHALRSTSGRATSCHPCHPSACLPRASKRRPGATRMSSPSRSSAITLIRACAASTSRRCRRCSEQS